MNFKKPLVQELSGIKRDKYPLKNADAANCKDDEDSGQETLLGCCNQ